MTVAREQPGRYPIRAVAKLTGIAIDTLRAWERRYGAVAPTRDDRGRLYSESDIARLRLLNRAVASGHSIGRVALLGDEELQRLTTASAPEPAASAPHPALDTKAFASALTTLDGAAIDREFSRLAAVLPPLELVRDVLMPTLRDAGDNWNRRRGCIAHEHLMSSTMRHLLGSFLRMYTRPHPGVRLLFATPAGDRHEIGILGAVMLAASQGIGAAYVGPDLPAREIVDASQAAGAAALVLGLTLASNRKVTERELRTIVRTLPPRVELWVGGPAAAAYAGVLASRAIVLENFDAYLMQLARIGEGPR